MCYNNQGYIDSLIGYKYEEIQIHHFYITQNSFVIHKNAVFNCLSIRAKKYPKAHARALVYNSKM